MLQYPYYSSYNPYSGQTRMPQLEAQQSYIPQYDTSSMNNQMSGFKGRRVFSLEEAKAAPIDLDGSLFVFADVGNNKIYTKQVNLNGIAELKTYELAVADKPVNEYVTRNELEKILTQMRAEFLTNAERSQEHDESINRERNGKTQTTVREQPTF